MDIYGELYFFIILVIKVNYFFNKQNLAFYET